MGSDTLLMYAHQAPEETEMAAGDDYMIVILRGRCVLKKRSGERQRFS